MSNQYLLHLPDGTQYGPIDRATFEAWSREGRLPADTLVWPEGAPEWLSLQKALAAPAARPATPAPAKPAAKPVAPVTSRPAAGRPVTAPPPENDRPETLPSMRVPAVGRKGLRARAGVDAMLAAWRPLAMTLVGVVVVLALVGGLWAVLRPYISRRQAMARVQQHALADRRVEDAQSGLVVELPTGWLALRRDNPFVERPEARVFLAQPAVSAFGSISVAPRPRQMDNLDGHLDELLQLRLPRLPSQKEAGRADVQLGKGQGRLVRTTWEDGLTPMQGATVAFADGYDLFSLDAWAPASAGEAFEAEVKALCQGVATKGQVRARLDEAVERLAVDVPELSRDALRLLVAERLSEGRGLEDVPTAALRAVNRGLDALAPAEATEMRGIYQQVWEPVPEAERVRLASLMTEIKAGRPVRGEDVLALRTVLKTGVLALPEEQRARLQELSGRAVRQSLLLP
jgi:type II secretory pathway pseudopilin PulG